MGMKVYTTMSGRRATTDINACAEAGHMTKASRYNTLFDYFEKPEMAPLLTALVEESAAPLATVETRFAVDSTGFGTAVYRSTGAIYRANKPIIGQAGVGGQSPPSAVTDLHPVGPDPAPVRP